MKAYVTSKQTITITFLLKVLENQTRGQQNSYLFPCLYTTYALIALILSNSDEKEVNGEIFERLDQAIQYNGDFVTSSRNPKNDWPSVCLSVQKSDKAVQVNSGLSQTTMQSWESVMLGHYGGQLLLIADFFFKLIMVLSI